MESGKGSAVLIVREIKMIEIKSQDLQRCHMPVLRREQLQLLQRMTYLLLRSLHHTSCWIPVIYIELCLHKDCVQFAVDSRLRLDQANVRLFSVNTPPLPASFEDY